MQTSLNKKLEASFKANWDFPAVTDYKGRTLYYRDIATRIAKLHILFDEAGLKVGDTAAICSRNQSNWGVAFLAAMTYGLVPVPILHEFKSDNIYNLVNHSGARVFFVGDVIWEGLSQSEMPGLECIVLLNDFSLLYNRNEKVEYVYSHLNEYFGRRYPKDFTPDNICYWEDGLDDLALINYTSGTSGFSKGVMLSYESLRSNVLFAEQYHGYFSNKHNMVSMLPTAHMYGLMFEFLYQMTKGAHVHFLTRIPSPKIIQEAMCEVKPSLIIAVPLVIEKIYKKSIEPIISRRDMKMLLHVPFLDQYLRERIKKSVEDALGGSFNEIIIGGAAFNREVEAFFRNIGFRFAVGYGMTECGPIITYAPWDKAKLYSCGIAAPRMSIKIDSTDPENIPGEILVKGANVFKGYYKNPEATAQCFTDDGWFRTGDMGVIDADGYLYIKGRCKSMILGPSGQNIYPEEIEGDINNMPYVNESLVIEDNGQLVALIYPDRDLASKDNLSEEQLLAALKANVAEMNTRIPNYCRVASVELFPEEFEKTPKKSIKRYLYQRS
ncbi:MAG: AMP-binding protein [Bacteroidales bacterium]|nr:AMP-binding protein [Bacteroidales bacterium]